MEDKNLKTAGSRYLFLSIGLLVSLLAILIVFESKSKAMPVCVLPTPESDGGFVEVIPQTIFEEPKPPKPKVHKLIEVTEEEETFELPPITIDYNEEDVIFEYPEELKGGEEPTNTFVPIPEVQASFPGGLKAWAKFLKKNISYPKLAKRAGIEGKVFLSFHIDSEGNVSNIKVERGIGGGCDDEAVRVLKLSPKWKPALQRGRAVKSPMNIHINFKLR